MGQVAVALPPTVERTLVSAIRLASIMEDGDPERVMIWIEDALPDEMGAMRGTRALRDLVARTLEHEEPPTEEAAWGARGRQ